MAVVPLGLHLPCRCILALGVSCSVANPIWLSRRGVVLPSVHHLAAAAGPQRRCKALQTRAEATGDADEEYTTKCLNELADASFLRPKFLSELPNDIRADLKDAAFALSNGAVRRECGQQVGELLQQIGQAWESGDTQSLGRLSKSMSSLWRDLPDNCTAKAALGKRLVGAGRRFKSTGQYGDGELQKIGNALIAAGEAVAAGCEPSTEEAGPWSSSRVLKFGTLQLEISSARAFTGAAIALAFGFLSWQLTQALQSLDNSTTYTNDNATLLATSLRGALLALGYSSTALSALSTLGLLGLGMQLRSGGK